jgi:hypothetical protein
MQHGAALVAVHHQELKAWNAVKRQLLTAKREQAVVQAKARSNLLQYVSN